jgi:hypothetical protein
MEIAIGIGLLVALIMLYVISAYYNEKTEIPEGCKDLTDFSGCPGCANTLCKMKKTIQKEKGHDQ